jgi:hypothetical protein
MIDYFEILKYGLIVTKYIIAILAIIGFIVILFITLAKAEDFASIVGLLIILIKLLLIYFAGIVFIYVFYYFTVALLFIIQQSLIYSGNDGKQIYSRIHYILDHILVILDLATKLFYNTPTMIIVNTITVIVLVILMCFYILYIIIKSLGFFFSFLLRISPLKELKDEGIFDFMDQIFSGSHIGNAIINFKPVKIAVNDLKIGLKKNGLYIEGQKQLQARNKANKEAALLKQKITKNGLQMSNSCNVEKFINYKLDMIETFTNNTDVSMKTIEENLKMCLLKNFKHTNPKIPIKEREDNNQKNKKKDIQCNFKAQIQKSLL